MSKRIRAVKAEVIGELDARRGLELDGVALAPHPRDGYVQRQERVVAIRKPRDLGAREILRVLGGDRRHQLAPEAYVEDRTAIRARLAGPGANLERDRSIRRPPGAEPEHATHRAA